MDKQKIKDYAKKKYGEIKEEYKQSAEKKKELRQIQKDAAFEASKIKAKELGRIQAEQTYKQKVSALKKPKGTFNVGGMSVGVRPQKDSGDMFGFGGFGEKPKKKGKKKAANPWEGVW